MPALNMIPSGNPCVSFANGTLTAGNSATFASDAKGVNAEPIETNPRMSF
jgi:hypothetical protein